MATSKDLQKAFYHSTFQRYDIVAPNIYLDWDFNEMDLFALRKSGYTDEIEIKLSKSDFKADFKKTVTVEDGFHERGYKEYKEILKHDALKDGVPHCNYFSFLMPVELMYKIEVPEYAGLYVYRENRHGEGSIQEVKKAPLLHKRKISDGMKFNVGRKMAYRYWKSV